MERLAAPKRAVVDAGSREPAKCGAAALAKPATAVYLAEMASPPLTTRQGGRRRGDWRRWMPRAAFECALIVFSVLLAMAVTGWVEDYRTAKRVREMRGFLRAEIQANRDLVARPDTLDHHLRLKAIFREALGDPEAPAPRGAARRAAQALFASGLHPAPVSDAVWASVSGGELMEKMAPKEVFALAALYRAQTNLEAMNQAGYDVSVGLVDLMVTGDDAEARLMRTVMTLEDITAQERRLLVLYDRALADLDDAPRIQAESSPAATTEAVGGAPSTKRQ